MLKSKLPLISIGIIFIIALFLRTFALTKIPVSLTPDEIAIGYNSQSILRTGADEFGVKFPLAFRSVGDYKPPLLIYTMIPAIGLLGLNEFSVRITIALIGALTVLLVFWISKQLSGKWLIAAITGFLVAISPWHIKFSRSTFEAVLALFLFLAGLNLFLFGLKRNGRLWWLSAISLALSMYAYHAERVFTPLFLLGLLIIFRKQMLELRSKLIVFLLIGLVVLIPLGLVLATPEGRIRAEVTFFSRDIDIHSQLYDSNQPQSIFDNNFLILANFWAKRYLDYYNFKFLFFDGMRFSISDSEDVGLLFLFELPFFLVGLYGILIKNQLNADAKKVWLLWVGLGPVAAAFANNPLHPLRALTLIPSLQLVSAVGFYNVIRFLEKPLKQFKKGQLKITAKILTLMGIVLAVMVILFNLVYAATMYTVVYQYNYSEGMMDGWKQAALFASENHNKYKEVIVDPRFGTLGLDTVGVPYLYFLFYGQVKPEVFQADPKRLEFNFGINFSNYTFREIDWLKDKENKDDLLIGSPWALPAQDSEIIKKFYLYNGKLILQAVVPK